MKLYYDPSYAMAATTFDTTRKASWVADSLAERPIEGVEMEAPLPLTADEIGAVHDPAYVRAVQTGAPRDLAASNDIGWDPDLFAAVAASNGGAVAAALWVLEHGGAAGSLSSGLHHARAGRGSGYCTFNGLALAARRAQMAGASRILVLDLDAHCGGGTCSLLEGDPGIVQLDVAVDPFDRYWPRAPWTLDMVHHAPDYLPTIERRLDALDDGRFDLVLYNAGMDPFEGCHVGGLRGIDHEMLTARERLVFERVRANGWPFAFVLAGGYAPTEQGRRQLVDLHRETITAAAAGGSR
jgi:acetoin utilization deacetylase AcuC-like enzyme